VFEFPFPGSLTSTFPRDSHIRLLSIDASRNHPWKLDGGNQTLDLSVQVSCSLFLLLSPSPPFALSLSLSLLLSPSLSFSLSLSRSLFHYSLSLTHTHSIRCGCARRVTNARTAPTSSASFSMRYTLFSSLLLSSLELSDTQVYEP